MLLSIEISFVKNEDVTKGGLIFLKNKLLVFELNFYPF